MDGGCEESTADDPDDEPKFTGAGRAYGFREAMSCSVTDIMGTDADIVCVDG